MHTAEKWAFYVSKCNAMPFKWIVNNLKSKWNSSRDERWCEMNFLFRIKDSMIIFTCTLLKIDKKRRKIFLRLKVFSASLWMFFRDNRITVQFFQLQLARPFLCVLLHGTTFCIALPWEGKLVSLFFATIYYYFSLIKATGFRMRGINPL